MQESSVVARATEPSFSLRPVEDESVFAIYLAGLRDVSIPTLPCAKYIFLIQVTRSSWNAQDPSFKRMKTSM